MRQRRQRQRRVALLNILSTNLNYSVNDDNVAFVTFLRSSGDDYGFKIILSSYLKLFRQNASLISLEPTLLLLQFLQFVILSSYLKYFIRQAFSAGSSSTRLCKQKIKQLRKIIRNGKVLLLRSTINLSVFLRLRIRFYASIKQLFNWERTQPSIGYIG